MAIIIDEATLVTPERVLIAPLRILNALVDQIGGWLRPDQGDILLRLPGHLIFPGLINAHDHLECNLFPRLGNRTYSNAYEWGKETFSRQREPVIDAILRVPMHKRLLWGGYKNLLSGVTTVAHHGIYVARTLDHGFPVRVLRDYGWSHSLGLGENVRRAYLRTIPDHPFLIHLAEGVDDVVAKELRLLDMMGAMRSNTVVVHGLGLSNSDIALLSRRVSGLIWCPSSNLFLFGKTLDIGRVKRQIKVALGTDATMTGVPNMLSELRVATEIGALSAYEVLKMVTSSAAEILRIAGLTGRMREGLAADLLVIRENAASSPHQRLLDINREDIRLVFRAGVPCFGDEDFQDLFEFCGVDFERIQVGDTDKLIVRGLNELVETVSDMLGGALPQRLI